ncbi:unannotated protein [freshwater metagenome]|uniref:Unannotated protein n=1 Tax=freshwater metagenome TaxID=449393 RepID=A0A6J6IWW5_9ZZZZ
MKLEPFATNAMPVAYAPEDGSLNSLTSWKYPSGIRMRIPAPSPLSGSAPDAPRCSMLRSAVSALETISCVAILLSVATIATPQASCSFAGL